MGIPRTQGLFYSPWQPLGIPFATTPIGQLHQSPPSPIPGDRARGKWRGFSPGAAARHRSRTKAPTDLQSTFFLCFPDFMWNWTSPTRFPAKSEIGHRRGPSHQSHVLEHRDTYGQAQVSGKGHQGSSVDRPCQLSFYWIKFCHARNPLPQSIRLRLSVLVHYWAGQGEWSLS